MQLSFPAGSKTQSWQYHFEACLGQPCCVTCSLCSARSLQVTQSFVVLRTDKLRCGLCCCTCCFSLQNLQQFMTMLSSSFGLQECKVLHGTHVSAGGNFVLRWLGCMHVQCAIVYAHKCHVCNCVVVCACCTLLVMMLSCTLLAQATPQVKVRKRPIPAWV